MASVITIRVDDRVHTELSALARAQDTTLSELARRTLGALIRPDDDEVARRGQLEDGERRPRTEDVEIPASLSTLERHQTAVLHRILARLVGPDGSGEDGDFDYQIAQAERLEKGYEAEYSSVFAGIEPELSRQESGLVKDIFDMFLLLEASYDRLNDADRVLMTDDAELDVRFGGFDANHRLEGRLLTYAQHLIDQGKWEALSKYFDSEHDHGNSHSARLAVYERMLAEFNPILREKHRSSSSSRGGFLLTRGEIQTVIDASVHPDNRRRLGR
jgi:uncharacterized protein YfbU (UPF0304 family)/predicted transcriptional regulator